MKEPLHNVGDIVVYNSHEYVVIHRVYDLDTGMYKYQLLPFNEKMIEYVSEYGVWKSQVV